MRIVYFIDHLRPDGTQRVLQQLVEGLAARGHEQAIVCWNDSWDETLLAAFKQSGATTRIVGKRALVTGCGILSTWLWLRREHFDVAVTLLFFSDVLGRTLAHLVRIPRIVSSIRARNINYASWQRRLVRYTMHWADAVILNSAAVKDFAIREEGANPEKVHIIPNSVCVEDYASHMSRETLRAELGLPLDQVVIGSVGRLTYQKGFDTLIRALALLRRTDIHLVLIGEGEERVALQRLARELRISSRVHFAGYRRDVPQMLGALDLYVQPSRFEGMPNALLEAMAAGCPVIASDVDGNREIIESELIGCCVPVEDYSVLASAIQRMLENGADTSQRAKVALHHIQSNFGMEHMVVNWERIIAKPQLGIID